MPDVKTDLDGASAEERRRLRNSGDTNARSNNSPRAWDTLKSKRKSGPEISPPVLPRAISSPIGIPGRPLFPNQLSSTSTDPLEIEVTFQPKKENDKENCGLSAKSFYGGAEGGFATPAGGEIVKRVALGEMNANYQSGLHLLAGTSAHHKSRKQNAGESEEIGFKNIGQTCYMNAVLQCLVGLQPLVDSITNFKSSVEKVMDTLENLGLDGRCKNLKTVHLDSLNSVIKAKQKKCDLERVLRHFLSCYVQENKAFSGFQQQDAHEFLIHLFTQIESECKSIRDVITQLGTECENSKPEILKEGEGTSSTKLVNPDKLKTLKQFSNNRLPVLSTFEYTLEEIRTCMNCKKETIGQIQDTVLKLNNSNCQTDNSKGGTNEFKSLQTFLRDTLNGEVVAICENCSSSDGTQTKAEMPQGAKKDDLESKNKEETKKEQEMNKGETKTGAAPREPRIHKVRELFTQIPQVLFLYLPRSYFADNTVIKTSNEVYIPQFLSLTDLVSKTNEVHMMDALDTIKLDNLLQEQRLLGDSVISEQLEQGLLGDSVISEQLDFSPVLSEERDLSTNDEVDLTKLTEEEQIELAFANSLLTAGMNKDKATRREEKLRKSEREYLHILSPPGSEIKKKVYRKTPKKTLRNSPASDYDADNSNDISNLAIEDISLAKAIEESLRTSQTKKLSPENIQKRAPTSPKDDCALDYSKSRQKADSVSDKSRTSKMLDFGEVASNTIDVPNFQKEHSNSVSVPEVMKEKGDRDLKLYVSPERLRNASVGSISNTVDSDDEKADKDEKSVEPANVSQGSVDMTSSSSAELSMLSESLDEGELDLDAENKGSLGEIIAKKAKFANNGVGNITNEELFTEFDLPRNEAADINTLSLALDLTTDRSSTPVQARPTSGCTRSSFLKSPEGFVEVPKPPGSNAFHEYKLTGLVAHIGTGSEYGHYVAVVYSFEKKKWFHYDDENVNCISFEKVLHNFKDTGYLFLYTHRAYCV